MADLKKNKLENPTIIWKRRLPLLTRLLQGKYIRKAKRLLDNYTCELASIHDKDSVSIIRIVKETIFRLNDLNESGEFIDTEEREDICLFINKTAAEAGLHIDQGEDITQEYRTW